MVFWPTRRAARRRRRKDDIDVSKSLCACVAQPAAEFLRLDDPGAGQHGAGEEPVAHIGIEIRRARPQPIEMQRAPSAVVMR